MRRLWVALWLLDVAAVLAVVLPFLAAVTPPAAGRDAASTLVAAVAAATCAVPYGAFVARARPDTQFRRAIFGGIGYTFAFLLVAALLTWLGSRSSAPNTAPWEVVLAYLFASPVALVLGWAIGTSHGLLARRFGRSASNTSIVT